MAPPDNETSSILTTLSNRVVLLIAGFFVLVGIVGVVIVAENIVPSGAPSEIVHALSEALMVTGATTLIVSFAFSDTVRLTPVIQGIFKNHAALFPSAADISDRLASTVDAKLDSAITPVTEAIQCVANDMKGLASAYVLARENIYAHSITMLHELPRGDVRILMTAEEDLSTGPEATGGSGEDWVATLNDWLSHDFHTRRLYRVIATRPQAPNDIDQVKTQLLKPFEGRHADQWVYSDPEFAVSVMLLGPKRAVFGFLPRPTSKPRSSDTKRSRFEYAVVITNEMLVGNLVTWFDERYTKDTFTTKVMTTGEIDDGKLAALTNGADASGDAK